MYTLLHQLKIVSPLAYKVSEFIVGTKCDLFLQAAKKPSKIISSHGFLKASVHEGIARTRPGSQFQDKICSADIDLIS